jgi:hypothetical protein
MSIPERPRRRAARWLLLTGTLITGCIETPHTSDNSSELGITITLGGTTTSTPTWWSSVRDQRQAELDAYLAANQTDFDWFKDAPLGSTGIPMVMFRLFPELFPEIWGAPSENFAKIGLGRDPSDPSKVLPLGLGFTSMPAETPIGPVDLQVVNLTCMGCHGGRVVDAAGKTKILVGAPNHQFTGFRPAIRRTVESAGFTADRFRVALLLKPPGWLYNDPTMLAQEVVERALFLAPGGAEAMIDALKIKVAASKARFAATITTHSYDVPNAPDLNGATPGYLDAFGTVIATVVDPSLYSDAELDAILPPAPGPADIMSTYMQNDRPRAQWDGSIIPPLHRNIGAEFGVVQDVSVVNFENAVRTTRFTGALPPPPYPFAVDQARATRGKALYDAYCASCHAPGSDELFAPAVVGTDPNRAIMFSATTAGLLVNALRIACTDPTECVPDGEPLADDEILQGTGAYMAIPLDGIWSRAPYLHNGSVPTLAALLTGDRPAQFYRGNTTFDQVNVGYTWDRAVTAGAAHFDTTRSGLSNVGHTSARFNGPIVWKQNPDKLADLLEYMKTL